MKCTAAFWCGEGVRRILERVENLNIGRKAVFCPMCAGAAGMKGNWWMMGVKQRIVGAVGALTLALGGVMLVTPTAHAASTSTYSYGDCHDYVVQNGGDPFIAFMACPEGATGQAALQDVCANLLAQDPGFYGDSEYACYVLAPQ
ncbi:hypothetical protein [Streptomyces sp. NPDC046161]|uniref:hypothetical protein n=1 Tax=Streptomyces sp. NPDC046161 TaxID=3155132 RepID=UPI0034033D2C